MAMRICSVSVFAWVNPNDCSEKEKRISFLIITGDAWVFANKSEGFMGILRWIGGFLTKKKQEELEQNAAYP